MCCREITRREKQEAYRKQLIQERKKDRETFLEEEVQRKEKEEEELCQHMRERFMTEQENKEYFENLEKQKMAQMKHNKAVWDKQCVSVKFLVVMGLLLFIFLFYYDFLWDLYKYI